MGFRGRRGRFSSRAIAAILALAIQLLILAVIIALGRLPGSNGSRRVSLTAIDIRGDKQAAKTPRPRQAARSAQKANPPRERPVDPQVTPPATLPPGFLNLSREEYAATDISRIPHRAPAAAPAVAVSDQGSAVGPGEGPGGVRLYNAEWVREPTQAELAPYFDGRTTAGDWATIACRTIEHFRVDDCQELDESPLGSGLARALRRASWQFLVRPPRAEGRALVGTWVRIRFDFSRKGRDGPD